jgi:inner membrane protein involved in colicin E2 resistance
MTGSSIALFFLLLLALSQKLAFGIAYAGAAARCHGAEWMDEKAFI